MLNELENFYLNQPEPNQSVFIFLRKFILKQDSDITPEWKYRLPFFYYKGKMLCYLWMDKTTQEPYVSFCDGNLIEHPLLDSGDRKRMKVFKINPNEDIDIDSLQQIIQAAIQLKKDSKGW